MLKKRHLALQGRVSSRDLAVPVEGSRLCSCSRVAVPSFDPGTWLQGAAEWSHHSRQAGTPRPQGRPTRGLAGTVPRNDTLRQVFLQLLLYLKPDGFVSEVVPYAASSPSFWPRSVVCGALLHALRLLCLRACRFPTLYRLRFFAFDIFDQEVYFKTRFSQCANVAFKRLNASRHV